jgi:hypothetical protein
MGVAITQNIKIKPEKVIGQKVKTAKKAKISAQDKDLMNNLKMLKEELDMIHSCFDYVTDETLIDSFIFQKMSLNMRYKYYLDMCKERDVVAF